jgi:hypothetical protein
MSARWRNDRVASFKLSCEGKTHTVHVLRSGGLHLVNHECDYRAWLIDDLHTRALIPARTKCVALWRAWRAAITSGAERFDVAQKPNSREKAPVTEKVRSAYEYVRQLRQVGQARAETDPLLHPVRERWTRRGLRTIRGVLELTEYDAGFHHVDYRVKQGANVSGRVDYNAAGLHAQIEIAVDPIRWLHHVFYQGVAVIEGVFVLDVLARYPDGTLLVVAGRPSTLLAIYPADGLVCPRSRRIVWLSSQFWREWIVDEPHGEKAHA